MSRFADMETWPMTAAELRELAESMGVADQVLVTIPSRIARELERRAIASR